MRTTTEVEMKRDIPSIGEVDLWWLYASDLNEVERARCWAWMTPEEHTQQQRFLRSEDQRMYLATRGLVRSALSTYADIQPKEWRFTTDTHGRPWISGPRLQPTWIFNVSHSRDLVVCAITSHGDLGVDVEGIDARRDILGIAKRFFVPEEYTALLGLSERNQQEQLFSAFWTLKEAYMKARGMGFAIEPQWLHISMQPALSMSFDRKVSDHPNRWAFSLGQLHTGHSLALAVSWGSTAPIPPEQIPANAPNTPDIEPTSLFAHLPDAERAPPASRDQRALPASRDLGYHLAAHSAARGLQVRLLHGREAIRAQSSAYTTPAKTPVTPSP